MDGEHTTPRYRVVFKRYTHAILKQQAQSMKLPMKVILASSIDLLSEFKLVSMRGGFLLSRREAVFEEERDTSMMTGWNTVFVEDKETVETLQGFSDKAGIPIYQIVDHLIRLVRDLKMLSTDHKGKVRLREAIENRNEPVQGEPDLEELYVRKDGELLAQATHTFTCDKGEIPAENIYFDCPLDGDSTTIEEGCLEWCDFLRMKVKRGFIIPDGCRLNYFVQLRLGYGRGEGLLREDAMVKGLEIYLQSISGTR